MFETAINSFKKHIGKLSDQELDCRLAKYNPNHYSRDITLNNLNRLPLIHKSYHTKIQHAGWFNISSDYFTEVSRFFTEVLDNPVPKENEWYKDPPIEDLLCSGSALLNPQHIIVGFLFKFAS
jgi:hypothetical protein